MRTNKHSPVLLTLGLLTALASPAYAGQPAASATRDTPAAKAAPRHPAKARAIEGIVNLNTATAAELGLLPGIGPAKVRAILARRTTQPFRTPDELDQVKGIGPAMMAALRPHLAVSGPTTIRLAGAAAKPTAPTTAAAMPRKP